MKTKLLILFILVMGFLFAISLFFASKKEVEAPEKITKKASLSILAPGHTTKNDVFKKTGLPSSIVTKEGKSYLYYETQNSSFKDSVVLENDIEIYALENIFQDRDLSLQSIITSYGKYETYYSMGSPFPWYVFLDRGVAVETDEKDILRILYFVPQKESGFFGFFGKELGFSKVRPTPGFLRP